ncbi:hypothetical protein HRI_001379500 [Hibiscus trionum]|uniref:Uncharacterized protein n=1 Tax=Hibiscus trionum TaxID=183268 RepID=A0A9W7LTN2_HIBTR|nr:hypothetical protein HRI_001379500 [Hibiscus trionum]
MKLSGYNFHGIIVFVFVMLCINSTSAITKFNVLNFGAKPNGRTDSTKVSSRHGMQHVARKTRASYMCRKGGIWFVHWSLKENTEALRSL